MQYNLKNPGPPPPPTDVAQNTNPPSQPSLGKPTVNSMTMSLADQERNTTPPSQPYLGKPTVHSTAVTIEDQEQAKCKKEEDSTIQAIIKELEQHQEMKELHHPTFNMLQSNGIATSKDYMMTNHIAPRTISAPVIDLGHMGPEYIPPPPCLTYETSIHPQINNLEDHPTQELYPDVITPRQHTSYQI